MATTTRQTLLIAVSLMAVISVAADGESVGQVRYKRHPLQLCELIRTYTGQGCLSYNNYGCFCGFGTPTATPVDDVDSCCRDHDRCYNGLINICRLPPHIIRYSQECLMHSCLCINSPMRSPCAYSTCICDLKLARCLKTATYNQSYHGWNRDLCVTA